MGSLVSLVMSDIVDSTRRWNAAEGAMAADLELHDRLIRDVVEGAGGSVFKHTGDGMIAVFDDPVEAVGAAAAIQRSIGDATWQHTDGLEVRAAVHTGVVYPRDGDLFGTAVNKLTRILSACPPGAVLVSNVVAGLLAERSPEGLGIRPLGEVTLTGFTAPEPVHAVTGTGMSAVVSPIAGSGLPRRGGELPLVDDELIGRADELAAILDGLSRARLVTLVGVGGMGKTRLALEVAAGSTSAFADGVWWIDLAAAASDEAVLPVALSAVGGREVAGRTGIESFCDRFIECRALIVLDNCEHVLGAAHSLAQAIRMAVPEVRVLATSREALGIRGEQMVSVGSLPSSDGVALFVERALAVRPELDITAESDVIERLCHRLDGIPLAIELAAARCRSMSPAEIDARLGDRFRLLRGGRSGAERHRTLQAAITWSYSLLDEDERHVFHHLAVCADGALIDALAHVCALDEYEVLDLVDRLVARSMVVASASPLGTRYHQLETLRQFAEERLVEAGTISTARDQHLAWMRHLAAQIKAAQLTPRAAQGFRRFCAEVENLRLAVAHAMNTARYAVAHEIVADLTNSATSRPIFEMLDWVRPIRLDTDWTDAAALCAAAGHTADWMRALPVSDGPVGGVPTRFIADHPVIAARHAMKLSGMFGRWDEGFELLEDAQPRTDEDHLEVEGSWLLLQWHRVRTLTPEIRAHDPARDEIYRRGMAAIELAQRLGGELWLASIEWRCALAFAFYFPDEAVRFASQAIEIGERLGADTHRDYATTAYQFTLAVLAEGRPEGRRDVAMAVRDPIARSLVTGNVDLTVALSRSVIGLIFDDDEATAYTLIALWRRFQKVNPRADAAPWIGVRMPDDWTEWERRAAHLSYRDGIQLLLDTLDRMIATEKNGGEG